VNGSDPPDGGGPGALVVATDPQIAYWSVGTTERLVLAYRDESGAFTPDAKSQTLTPKSPRTESAISFSADRGRTWIRSGPVMAQPDACAGSTSQCAFGLAGAPAIAPRETTLNVLLASLAFTKDGLDTPDALAVAYSQDLVSWSPPLITAYKAGRTPEAPTLARARDRSVLAFTDHERGRLWLASSMSDPPQFLAPELIPLSDDDAHKAMPIVHLTNAEQGHVAFMIPHGEDGTTFDLRVLHIWRTVSVLNVATPWQSSTIFKLDGVSIEPAFPGALDRAWRDDHPMAFAVGNNGQHFWLAFRQRSTSTGQSAVALIECDASYAPECVVDSFGQNSGGWTLHEFASAGGGAQMMPVLAADKDSDSAALAWLEQTSGAAITVRGTTTTDGALHFSAPRDLRADGDAGAFTPCPSANAIAGTTHYYASRMGQAVFPFDPMGSDPLAVVTAHPDSSGGCSALGDLTHDLHVGVVAW
jgi:hypothetical protein